MKIFFACQQSLTGFLLCPVAHDLCPVTCVETVENGHLLTNKGIM